VIISEVKVSELSKISEIQKPVITRYFKDGFDQLVTRNNGRITGISPEAVTQFLLAHGIDYFDRGGVILTGNLCGGVGKTTGTYSLSASARRTHTRIDPIVVIDTDSQASLSKSASGSPARDDELILIDFLEGKAKIEDILTDMGNNVWFVKSNLNQIYMDKILSTPNNIKNKMLHFYKEIFRHLGPKTKIFQDHTPQLSNIFASSLCAISQLDPKFLRAVMIPMRSDDYAIDGAEKMLNEIKELQDTFSLDTSIDIHCYFSSIDRRISTTSEAIKGAKKRDAIINYLSPVVIQYCSEIPKSIQQSSNVYSSGKSNNAAEDYQDLLQYIFSFKKDVEAA